MTITPAMTAFVVAMAGMMLPAMAENGEILHINTESGVQ